MANVPLPPESTGEQLLYQIMEAAEKERASDIHIEPKGDEVIVRLRIDGILKEIARFEVAFLEPLVSRLKVMAQLDITAHATPQEGHFEWISQIISEGNIDEIMKKLREVKKDSLANISDIDLKKKIEAHLDERKKEIVVPSDYRTMASSWNKEGQYMYNGRGGISWSVPYLAGLFALILQVNPNIKREEIAEIIKESAVINKKGLRIVNPKGIIDLVKAILSNFKQEF